MTDVPAHDLSDSDPLRALGLASDAGVDDVKRAYRKLVRHYRPERDPDGFQRLQKVYAAALDAAEYGSWDEDDDDEDPVNDDAVVVDDDGPPPLPATTLVGGTWSDAWDELEEELSELAGSGRWNDLDDRLDEKRAELLASSPDQWALLLAEVAGPHVADHFRARDLVREAAEVPIEDEWVFHRIEHLRTLLPALQEVPVVEADDRIPHELRTIVLRTWDADDDDLVAALVELGRAKRLDRWGWDDAIERLEKRGPETKDLFFALKERASQIAFAEACDGGPDAEDALRARMVAVGREVDARIRFGATLAMIISVLLLLAAIGAIIYIWIGLDWGVLRGVTRRLMASIGVLGGVAWVAMKLASRLYHAGVRPRVAGALHQLRLLPPAFIESVLGIDPGWLLRVALVTGIEDDHDLYFECVEHLWGEDEGGG